MGAPAAPAPMAASEGSSAGTQVQPGKVGTGGPPLEPPALAAPVRSASPAGEHPTPILFSERPRVATQRVTTEIPGSGQPHSLGVQSVPCTPYTSPHHLGPQSSASGSSRVPRVIPGAPSPVPSHRAELPSSRGTSAAGPTHPRLLAQLWVFLIPAQGAPSPPRLHRWAVFAFVFLPEERVHGGAWDGGAWDAATARRAPKAGGGRR